MRKSRTLENDISKFCPSAFKCMVCKIKVSLQYDSFMASCCGIGVVCHYCCTERNENKCHRCGEEICIFRIRARFFKSIEDEFKEWMVKKIKEQETKAIRQSEQERPIEDPRGDILRSIYEKKPFVMDV